MGTFPCSSQWYQIGSTWIDPPEKGEKYPVCLEGPPEKNIRTVMPMASHANTASWVTIEIATRAINIRIIFSPFKSDFVECVAL
jgi:hypothetical protein